MRVKSAGKALMLLAVVVMAVVVVRGVTSDPDSSGPVTSSPTTSAPAPTATTPVTSPSPDSTGGLPPEDPHQRQVVDAFAAAFASPADQQDWLAALEPLVTPDLLAGFEFTDASARLRGKVTDVAPMPLPGSWAIAYSSGLRVRVQVIETAAGWRVSDVNPVVEPVPDGRDV